MNIRSAKHAKSSVLRISTIRQSALLHIFFLEKHLAIGSEPTT
jgi:hypothetical protein